MAKTEESETAPEQEPIKEDENPTISTPAASPSPAPEKSNTRLFIIIGIVALVIILLVVCAIPVITLNFMAGGISSQYNKASNAVEGDVVITEEETEVVSEGTEVTLLISTSNILGNALDSGGEVRLECAATATTPEGSFPGVSVAKVTGLNNREILPGEKLTGEEVMVTFSVPDESVQQVTDAGSAKAIFTVMPMGDEPQLNE